MTQLTGLLHRSRLLVHVPAFLLLWVVLSRLNGIVDPLWSSYLGLAAMYATAMLGMVVLVGLSGQVSLGNGALMAVGGYAFAVSSMQWTTVPILGLPWNAVYSVIVASLAGIVIGLVVGFVGARLRGPYLAGLTLGLAVGIPALASRLPAVFGGNQGLVITVPYPEGGYAAEAAGESAGDAQAALDAALGGGASPEAAASMEPSALASSDMLSMDDVTAGASPMASSDMLTMDDVTAGASPMASAEPSAMASSDMLTLDDVQSGASAMPDASAIPSGMPDAGALPDPTAVPVDAGFVLERWQGSVAIAVACIAGFIALNLVRGRQGRVWRAVRDDPIAAAVSGIDPAGAKISAFVVSSFFAALAGAVYAQILAYVGPSAFTIGLSLSLLVGVVLGGRGSLLGAAIGAVLIVGLPIVISGLAEGRDWPTQVASNAPSLAYGLLVVLVVLAAPAGIVGLVRRRRG